MAIVIALHGFNDLGYWVTPISLLMDHLLYRFLKFAKFHLSRSSLSWWQFQMPLEGLRFVKTLAAFGIINTTYSLIQNITRIVCL